MSVENIMFFRIIGIPVCVYLFVVCISALVGMFLWAVAGAETELEKLREARRKWRQAKAERDAAFIKLMGARRQRFN